MSNSSESVDKTELRIVFGLDGVLEVSHNKWKELHLKGRPEVYFTEGAVEMQWQSGLEGGVYCGKGVKLELQAKQLASEAWALSGRLVAGRSGTLERIELLSSGNAHFGADSSRVRVMTLSRYGGDVRPLGEGGAAKEKSEGEPGAASETPQGRQNFTSQDVAVIYGGVAKQALLIGFMSSERWQGRIHLTTGSGGEVVWLGIGFDGGALALAAGEELVFEPFVILSGSEPWSLLEQYGELVRSRYGIVCPEPPPVSWCSWYPYRLSVSEERILAEARIAVERLKPLGLSIMEVDLGWERRHLPNAFEPNDRFQHGLKWLAERLAELGFRLGVWKAPFTISEFDVLAKEHPEWLIQDETGKPVSTGTWFWEPHGNTYILDLTHPGAQQWLREKMAGLNEAGVKYFKADFIGTVSGGRAKRRYDRRIVAGGGTEAARLGARIIREALPEALILNCGGPQMPGTGTWPLLYICNDTGNTGLLSWEFMRTNFRAMACHLWQNRRWGIIQPSCLCVGLPGTLEEARVRATVAFMAGGQIDISDTLTTLLEDRWAVLEATLPPLGITARPVDLFEPVFNCKASDYEALCKGQPTEMKKVEHTPGSVWHLHVKRDWDEWDLAAFFNFNQCAGSERPELVNFTVPLEKFGLDPKGRYWAFEFWSGQFLGALPGGRVNNGGYTHPGDWQDLLVLGSEGTLSLSFTGPSVKLLALRRVRPHPWPVGTSFHQSCGAELQEVRWDPAQKSLSGRICRPAGQSGTLYICTAGCRYVSAEANGVEISLLAGAHAGLKLPIATREKDTYWKIKFVVPDAAKLGH